MDLNSVLNEEKETINSNIGIFFFKKMISLTNPYIIKYLSEIKQYILTGGKRLRPIALVNAYKGKEGKNLDEIYKLSICVELLHNASLIHDDIIDHDKVRRGQPSFHIASQDWFVYNLGPLADREDLGIALGIIGGDLLINLGLEPISLSQFPSESVTKAVTYYQQAFNDLIKGVLFETYLQNLPLNIVTEMNYLEMIQGKTAALFEKSVLIGALFGDSSEKDKDNLSQFASSVGKAFQIRDDVLGVFGSVKKIGKPTDSDIREGKKTLLAIYANRKDPTVQELLGKPGITNQEIEQLKQIFEKTGALEQTKEKALKFADQARKFLDKITFTERINEFFSKLIDFVQFRDK